MTGRFEIAKLDEDQRLVFGYASLSIAKDGTPLTDTDNDQIEPHELERAAYDFVLNSRATGEMHQGVAKGALVESFVFTPEKLAKMGLPPDLVPARWWVGFKVDPDTFAKVKSGVYKHFSIQGSATREEIPA